MSQIWDDGDQNPIFLGAGSTQAPRVWFTFLFLFSLCYFAFHFSVCLNPRLGCLHCLSMSRSTITRVSRALSCLVYPACFALFRLSLMSCVVSQCLNPSLVCLAWLELSRLSNLSWVVSVVSVVLRCVVVLLFLHLLALKALRKVFNCHVSISCLRIVSSSGSELSAYLMLSEVVSWVHPLTLLSDQVASASGNIDSGAHSMSFISLLRFAF
jgi:hypothetical protein